ncbi:MAG TPA: glycosyltransferase [Chloroflexia bacterium]|nr:glycosyltransferase [Chloroflexia bacterium]
MLKVTIVASGTRGDVQPYIALGKGLKQAGYDVRVLTNANFETLVTEAGLAFSSIGESIEAITQSEEWRRIAESSNFLKILSQMRTEMKRYATAVARRLPDLLEGSDLIIAGMAAMLGVFSIAEMRKIPLIQAYLFPFTPTSQFPSPLTPGLPPLGTLNRLSFQAMRQMFWQSSKMADVLTRQQQGLAKGSFWGPYRELARKDMPVLYGYSRHVLPHPQDWPATHRVTGYWFLDEPEGWIPPASLVEFLQAGEPPVYIGFGSMSNRDPREAGQLALEALELSGQRGVIASGWGGLQPTELPKNVFLISSIPHSWLFPRMAAVVHHGGVGTTAAGLRAGIPSILIPFMGDQAFWGQRVAALGVGPKPIPRKKLTGKLLAGAIKESLSNPLVSQKASELGQKISAENGIKEVAEVVDRYNR